MKLSRRERPSGAGRARVDVDPDLGAVPRFCVCLLDAVSKSNRCKCSDCSLNCEEIRKTTSSLNVPKIVRSGTVTDSRQPTADSRQQTADSRQPTADSRQPTAVQSCSQLSQRGAELNLGTVETCSSRSGSLDSFGKPPHFVHAVPQLASQKQSIAIYIIAGHGVVSDAIQNSAVWLHVAAGAKRSMNTTVSTQARRQRYVVARERESLRTCRATRNL